LGLGRIVIRRICLTSVDDFSDQTGKQGIQDTPLKAFPIVPKPLREVPDVLLLPVLVDGARGAAAVDDVDDPEKPLVGAYPPAGARPP
jgi:hypothetical protein